jgi:RNA recognition motif-containing protein
MGKKLYVGNLSYTVDSNQLSDLFAQAGTVDSANVIMDRDTGRSKGFGFVEMSAPNEAQAAIEKFNGADLGGRAMNVSEAKPQAPREGGGGGGGGFKSRRY